jgi:hypothetical protein
MLKNPILTTRFNKDTWRENCLYREKEKVGCIYGSPFILNKNFEANTLIFVIEMNNSLNRIEGIGLIKNNAFICDKKCSIYDMGNYNRYVYKGSIRIDRDILIIYNRSLVEVLDYILFKGKSHLKRGTSFMKITEKLFQKEECRLVGEEDDFKKAITIIFKEVKNRDKNKL